MKIDQDKLIKLNIFLLIVFMTSNAYCQSYVPSGAQASSAFYNLYLTIQDFAGILLCIGIVISGLLFLAKQMVWAIFALIGTVVCFGGPYLVGLLKGGLGK